RRPAQHAIWGLPNVQGLSNFAVGEVALKDAIVLQEPNLHVLPAGIIPSNPLAILESQHIAPLLNACEKAYDYIIIDTPPILGLADALTIGRATDGILLVMRPGKADADSIFATKTMLSQSQQKVLGLVANGIDVKGRPDHYFSKKQDYYLLNNRSSQVMDSSNNTHDVNGQVSVNSHL
ncbi:tyrosine-protein kinase family protein, partial [Leptothoe sp. PORK10 BA2]|uniref:tyrosine-protein kinase family protein n=1 Tax=Leptothoe sp. PORK10 BA2 TaxID=3110254 RepID=UPI002B1F4575